MSLRASISPVPLILTAMATVIATVVALDFYGLLRHNTDKDALPVGEFKAVFLGAGDDFRLSSKAPVLHAQCQDRLLVIASDTDPNMRGVLVDYKNRGVRCSGEMAEETLLQENQPEQ